MYVYTYSRLPHKAQSVQNNQHPEPDFCSQRQYNNQTVITYIYVIFLDFLLLFSSGFLCPTPLNGIRDMQLCGLLPIILIDAPLIDFAPATRSYPHNPLLRSGQTAKSATRSLARSESKSIQSQFKFIPVRGILHSCRSARYRTKGPEPRTVMSNAALHGLLGWFRGTGGGSVKRKLEGSPG